MCNWSLKWARLVPEVTRLLLVVAERDRARAEAALAAESAVELAVQLVVGGPTRHASEWEALRALSAEIRSGHLDVVVMHDAARPLAGPDVFAEVIRRAHEHGGALPVRPQPGLIPVDQAFLLEDDIVAVQTPQAFRAGPLLAAYEQAHEMGFGGTDTAGCVEQFTDLQVHCVAGPAHNIKVTFAEDLVLAAQLLTRAHAERPPRSAEDR